MKHSTDFPVATLVQRGLPEAPLVMERQVLERNFNWGGVFRLWRLARPRRS